MRCRAWAALRTRAATDRAFLCRLGVECGLDVALMLAAVLHAARRRPRGETLRSAIGQASTDSVAVAGQRCCSCWGGAPGGQAWQVAQSGKMILFCSGGLACVRVCREVASAWRSSLVYTHILALTTMCTCWLLDRLCFAA